MGRPTSSRLTFYAGAAANAALWVFVLIDPVYSADSPRPDQSVPVFAVSVCALVGTVMVSVLLLDQVKHRPALAPSVLSTFTLSMLAYTLVYWAGKSAFTSMVTIPTVVEWIVRGVASVAILVGISRLNSKRRYLIALAGLTLVVILPAFDLVLLGLAGALGGLCTRWSQCGNVRILRWALGLATLGASLVASRALLSLSASSILVFLQAAVVAAATAIQAYNLHVLTLLSKAPLDPPDLTEQTSTEGVFTHG